MRRAALVGLLGMLAVALIGAVVVELLSPRRRGRC